jgi:uncharacterized damage-inducible protein DinB
MSAPHLTQLARHMAWADASVWKAVLALPADANDAKIGDTLHHMHLVQHIFLQSWIRAPFKVRERGEFASIADLAAWAREAHGGTLSFLEGATADQLDSEFRVPWAVHFEQRSKQPAGVHTLAESVLQTILHTQHHRGQVCTRLREVGAEPPTIDFIVWLWAGRPAADWT